MRNNPDGVINDRWGDTHCDYRTSEYEAHTDNEAGHNWEQCRGIGLSFGYNQVEGPEQYVDGLGLSRLLSDIVSRGGRLLINVGPTADGQIPDIQQHALRGLGRWMRDAKNLLTTAAPVDPRIAAPSDDPWVRWLRTPTQLVALVDHTAPPPCRWKDPTSTSVERPHCQRSKGLRRHCPTTTES